MIVVQWIASAFGGYLTGRMRARSFEPSDEVFFRDTANGFLAWALSTLLVAALLTSALSAIVSTAAQVAATVASGPAQAAMQAGVQSDAASVADPTAYFVDTLYRPTPSSGSTTSTAGAAPDTTAASPDSTPMPITAPAAGTVGKQEFADVRAETTRILMSGLAAQDFPAADLDYLGQLVSARSGLSPDAAKERVNEVLQKMQAVKTEAQAAADQARKNATKLSLFMFLSLIVGAFIAAAAAALGGGQRDDAPAKIGR